MLLCFLIIRLRCMHMRHYVWKLTHTICELFTTFSGAMYAMVIGGMESKLTTAHESAMTISPDEIPHYLHAIKSRHNPYSWIMSSHVIKSNRPKFVRLMYWYINGYMMKWYISKCQPVCYINCYLFIDVYTSYHWHNGHSDIRWPSGRQSHRQFVW